MESLDIRHFLTKGEIMKLADLEVLAMRTNNLDTFNKACTIVEGYYRIANMRKEIHLLKKQGASSVSPANLRSRVS